MNEQMTDVAATQAVGTHPLDPITAEEITSLKAILEAAGHKGKGVRYSYIMLTEPSRETMTAFHAGHNVPREVGVLVTDIPARIMSQIAVDLTAKAILKEVSLDPKTDGWGPVLDEEYEAADVICKADPRFVEALAKRGITDMNAVFCAPLSAGVFGYDDEVGRRMLRVLAFYAPDPDKVHMLWARPIEGVVCHVDLSDARVLRFVDTGYTHIPEDADDYLDPTIPPSSELKPLNITQPGGPSFTMENNVLKWKNWSVRVGFNAREGLTLHDISFRDQGVERPILNRAAVSEMVVPYGEPQPTHEWQNYFDAGEYQYGRLANSLVLGCDCLGEIHYVDATVADDFCNPMEIKNAICIHEEDFGTLWKHTCVFSGKTDVRRQRRLVVSFFVTVGNYDYGFYWYFYLDGKIELECKATGCVFTSGRPEGEYEWATEMAPRLGAPIHQHMFSARLDVAVDGNKNCVDEIDVQRVPMGENNPVGNAFTRRFTRLKTESDAQRIARNDLGRTWLITSADKTNRVGHPTGYALFPEGLPLLLADDNASITKRAGFATKSLWVTQFDRDELWAAGYTPNQHPGGAGLPAYTANDRAVDGEDIVVWHTFGLTHFPRSEDWPIMPVDYAGFSLKPENFFDRNPTLDVPADPNAASCCHSNKQPAE